MQTYIEKSLALVSVNSLGKFILHPEGVTFLRSLPQPLSVLSITGPILTGKSFLANQILSKKGFKTRSSEERGTKGLWVWGKRLLAESQEGKITNVILIDADGFGCSHPTGEEQMTALLLLISSVLVYNSKGVIGEESLRQMECVMEVARGLGQAGDSKATLNSCDLHWVLRDFEGYLTNEFGQPISEDQYMENSFLRAQDHASASTVSAIKQYFPSRTCHCVTRPNISEEEKPEFTEQMIELRRSLTRNIKSMSLDGSQLVILLESYVEAINNGERLGTILQEGYDCLVRLHCLDKFDEELKQLELGKEDLDEQVLALKNNVKESFKNRMRSAKQIEVLQNQLKEMIQDFQENELAYHSTKSLPKQSRFLIKRNARSPRASIESRNYLNPSETHKSARFLEIQREKSERYKSKCEQFATRIHRYELEASCSEEQMGLLRGEHQKLQQEYEKRIAALEENEASLLERQLALQKIIYQQGEQLQELREKHTLALSEIDKQALLHRQKIQFLERKLEDQARERQHELQAERQLRISQVSRNRQEIEAMGKKHQEELEQTRLEGKEVREAWQSPVDLYLKEMRGQQEAMDCLKEESMRLNRLNCEMQDDIKKSLQLKSKMEREKRQMEEEFLRKIRDAEIKAKDFSVSQLACKEQLILELTARNHTLTAQLSECKLLLATHIQTSLTENIHILELRCSQLEQEKEALIQQLDRIRRQLSSKETQMRDLIEEDSALKAKLSETERQSCELEVQMKSELSLHHSRLHQKQIEVAQLNATIGDYIQRLDRSETHYQSQIQELSSQRELSRTHLEAKVSQLSLKLEQVGSSLASQQAKEASSWVETQNIRQREAAQAQRIMSLERQIGCANQAREELTVKLGVLRDESSRQRLELESQNEGIRQELSEIQRESGERVRNLSVELSRQTQSQISAAEQFEMRIIQMRHSTDAGWREKLDLTEQKRRKREQELRVQIEKLQGENSVLRDNLIGPQRQLALAKQSCLFKTSTLESNIAHLSAVLSKCESHSKEVSLQLRKQQEEVESQKKLVDVLSSDRACLIQNMTDLQRHLRQSEHNYEGQFRASKAQAGQIAYLRQKLARYQTECQQLRKSKVLMESNYEKDCRVWKGH